MDEGDTLSLDCDSSNSAATPPVHWVSSSGEMVSNDRSLEIINITRHMAGIYTCVATSINDGSTANTSVNVTVESECIQLFN